MADTTGASGSISEVKFYLDGGLLLTDKSAPFETSWTAQGGGAHTVQAKVYANGNAGPQSQIVNIQIVDNVSDGSLAWANNRVLSGFWETWQATIHSAGHIHLNEISDQYNVVNIAFPILVNGTAVLEDEMAPGEDPPEPAEVAQAQAEGRKVLVSIGGAAAGMDLTSPTVIDNFVNSIIPIIELYNLDGIDIDIETGLVAGASMTQLSPSQEGLINAIRRVMDHFGPDFMLTMAPETAYVTGGSIAWGGPYGAYLPIINAFRNELSWLQMQYYNGIMYGDGTTHEAGTVVGMVEQTKALINGFTIAQNGQFQGLPAEKVVIGLPATAGAGGGEMSPSAVQQGFDQLLALYPNLRGLMTWSVNWDASNGYEYANSHGPYLRSKSPIQPW